MKRIRFLMITLISLTLCLLNGCNQETPTIDINKYVIINIDGYDSIGTLSVNLDISQLKRDYGTKLKYNSSNKQLGYDPFTSSISRIGYDPYEDLIYYIGYDVNKATNLSNGDIVHIYWICDEQEFEEVYNCKIKYSNIDVEVKDLQVIDTFDPFQHVEIYPKGIIPDAKIKVDVDYDIEYMEYIDFDVVTSLDEYDHNNFDEQLAMQPQNIQNGDIVYIKPYLNCPANTFADKYGMVPNLTSKEFTVSGLSRYCDSNEELPDDLIKEFQVSCEDIIRQYIDNGMPNSQNFKKLSYIGYYFTVPDDVSYKYGENNKIFLIYKIEFKDSSSKYYFVSYTNIYEDVDGNMHVEDTAKPQKPAREGLYVNGLFNYIGYQSLEAFEVENITYENYRYRKYINE